MNSTTRTKSILQSASLDSTLTGFLNFDLRSLDIQKISDFELPTNIRLGHLVEKVVSMLIQQSTNFKIIYENVQIIENQKTIGEIDFIIENTASKQQLHLELAYKFYLFDPSISSEPILNWIGPNRNDSLSEKLYKLKTKQFPLLFHPCTVSQLENIDVSTITQKLCLLVSLFIPYNLKTELDPIYLPAIKGFYINLKTFIELHNPDNLYYLPTKKEWGMHPATNETWQELHIIENELKLNRLDKQSLLCWQKQGNQYTQLFIVWW